MDVPGGKGNSARAVRLGVLLVDAPVLGEQRTGAGEAYTALAVGLVVEVLAGTGRPGTLTAGSLSAPGLPLCSGPLYSVAARVSGSSPAKR